MRLDMREFLRTARSIPASEMHWLVTEMHWLVYPWTIAMPFIREQGSLR